MESTDMKNSVKFKEYMAALCEVHNREPLTFTLNDIYWKTLEPFDDQVCESAFKHLLMHTKFFPKPSEFLEILEGNNQDQAMLAWLKVTRAIRRIGTYQSVRFDDPVIHATIQAMGGWVSLGDVLEKDLPWKQREFERIYAAIAGRPNGDHPEYLPGRCEMENVLTGYQDYKSEIIEIGFEKQALQIADKSEF